MRVAVWNVSLPRYITINVKIWVCSLRGWPRVEVQLTSLVKMFSCGHTSIFKGPGADPHVYIYAHTHTHAHTLHTHLWMIVYKKRTPSVP